MPKGIRRIETSLPFGMGSANCYLVETGNGFVLIDTGSAGRRAELEAGLDGAGCRQGNLNLIVLTHGDFDHAGNCAYIREKFGTKAAMHPDDAGMVERGDMFLNRELGSVVVRLAANLLYGLRKRDRFEPDLLVEDGYNLTQHGLEATVLSLPGHSKGSIGILTASGDLFCGDLLENRENPASNSLVDNRAAMEASIDRLRGLEINIIYPGHGEPFPMAMFPS